MDNSTLTKKMSRLKMSGMIATLEQRLAQAMQEKWGYSTLVETLLTDEIERRNHRQLTLRLAKSHLDLRKSLETFNFSFNSNIPAAFIREISSCSFMERAQNIFILGQSGVGKSHIAQALGHQACRREYDVLFYNTHALFDWIQAGKGDGTYKRRLAQVIKVPLLILDDFGLQALNEAQQNDLYQVIDEKYEKRSLIITSNKDIAEWASIFTNTLLGTAALDRLVHKGQKITIEGPSYRLDEFKKACENAKKM